MHSQLSRSRTLCVLSICLILQAAFLAGLTLFADLRVPGFPLWFTACGWGAGIAYLLAVRALNPLSQQPTRAQWALLWGGALAFRAILLQAEPGDDIWRYLWEGAIQWHGVNPYVTAPAAPELSALREHFAFSSSVGHPEWRTIYPPAAELIFRALSGLTPSVILFKLCFTLADLGVLALLVRVTRDRADCLLVAALYAWNPLIIHSFAGAGHYDSLMLLPLVAAFWLLTRYWAAVPAGVPIWRWVVAPSPVPVSAATGIALLLGLAISIKLVPLALVPVFAIALQRKAPILLLSALPLPLLAMAYGFPQVPIWESLRDFANVSRTNALLWWVTEHFWRPDEYGRNGVYNLTMLAAALLCALITWRNPARGLLATTGALLLFSHTLHSWYVVWLIPWACLQRSWFWLVGSVSIFGYYLLWADTALWAAWQMHPLILASQVIPPILVLLAGWHLSRNRRVGSGEEVAAGSSSSGG